MNKPHPFPGSYLISFLLNLTHTTPLKSALPISILLAFLGWTS
jgi:hypothetical protein